MVTVALAPLEDALTMPAPLGKTPTKKMPNIQVFGMEDSNATRGALRFFRERRIVVHYVDLRKKPIAAGRAAPVRRPARRAGGDGHGRPRLSRRRASPTSRPTRPRSPQRLLADVRLLRLPLVRYGDDVTAGKAEETWKAWLARPR